MKFLKRLLRLYFSWVCREVELFIMYVQRPISRFRWHLGHIIFWRRRQNELAWHPNDLFPPQFNAEDLLLPRSITFNSQVKEITQEEDDRIRNIFKEIFDMMNEEANKINKFDIMNMP